MNQGILTAMGTNRYIKTTIIGWVLLITVIGFYVSLFLLRQWLVSWIWAVAVFCILPYAIIYFHRHWKYGIRAIAVMSIGFGFYLGWSIYLALGFLAALIGLYQTSDTIYEDVHNKIKVSPYDVFTGESVEKFVTYISMVYVFTFLAFYQSFDLTCKELYSYSDKAVNIALLRNSPELTATIDSYIDSFFTASIGQVLDAPSVQQIIETSTKTTVTNNNNTNQSPTKITSQDNDPGAKYRVTKPQTGQTNTSSTTTTDKPTTHDAPTVSKTTSTTVLQTIADYRKRLVEQTIDSSDQVEQGVCAMLIKEIKTKYNDPEFKISVLFMMYIIIRPAMEMVVHLISYINRAVFEGMFKFKRFRKYEDREVGENLE